MNRRLRPHGVLPRTGSGVPGADGDGDGEGLTGPLVVAEGGEAAGLVLGPGWVPGGAGGGLIAAAGWLWASECGPVTEVGFGVVAAVETGDAVGVGDGVEAAGLAAL